jgi:hypothetical protein
MEQMVISKPKLQLLVRATESLSSNQYGGEKVIRSLARKSYSALSSQREQPVLLVELGPEEAEEAIYILQLIDKPDVGDSVKYDLWLRKYFPAGVSFETGRLGRGGL